jgi:hypothetical protein
MDEAEVAALVGDTISWAQGQASFPVITSVEALDIGEVTLTMVDGSRYRLGVSRIEEPSAND